MRRALGLLAVLGALAQPGAVPAQQTGAAGSEPAPEFEGRIEALRHAEVSSALNSLVLKVHFDPGQRVEQGDALFTLDDTDQRIELETARANVLRAELTLVSARDELERTRELAERGAAAGVALFKAEAAHTLADAMLAKARASHDAAQLQLDRTVIRAPIGGRIGAPRVAQGAFVKANGKVLAEIVQLDPVRLSYRVPYVARLKQLGIETLSFPDSLLDRVDLTVIVPGGWEHPQRARPSHVSPDLDPETGMMTIWAEVANPQALLRPGMAVRVRPTQRPDQR